MRLGVTALAVTGLAMPLTSAAQDGDRFTLGRWEQISVMTGVTLDGRPVDAELAPTETAFACLATPEDAAPLAYFGQLHQDECAVNAASAASGRIRLAVSCVQADGDPLTMEFTGGYTARDYRLTFVRRSRDPKGAVEVTGTIAGRNVGACVGDE